MQSKATTVDEYLNEVPPGRRAGFEKLRQTVLNNLPTGYEETMSYGMIGYVVPHSIYPAGYHCSPELALPFMNIASQKKFIAFYHMGLYASKEFLDWFTTAFAKESKYRLDMGKSCIRFKNPEQIPFALIGRLVKKMPVKDWIQLYEQQMKR